MNEQSNKRDTRFFLRFWREVRGYVWLYLFTFILLALLLFLWEGFNTISGFLYFILLATVFLLLFTTYLFFKKKKQFLKQQAEAADAAMQREQAASYAKKYNEHLLFINRWVHYIKTPLSVMRAIIQDEEDSFDSVENVSQTDSEHYQEVLVQIKAESDRILDGVNSALNFARATDFENDFKIEYFDLQKAISETINELKGNFIRAKVYPDLQISLGTEIESDRKWLKFIFFQLLTNAIKYSHPESKVSIYISENDKDTICVEDRGIGIASEDVGSIFAIFYTGTNGRIMGESTGIGLYLVRTICDKLDYKISVESRLGKGTIFSLHTGNRGH